MAVEQGLCAQWIYRDLADECSFTGTYTTLNAGSLRRTSMMPGVLPEPQSQPALEQQQLRKRGRSGQLQPLQNGKAFNHLDALPTIMIHIPQIGDAMRRESGRISDKTCTTILCPAPRASADLPPAVNGLCAR